MSVNVSPGRLRAGIGDGAVHEPYRPLAAILVTSNPPIQAATLLLHDGIRHGRHSLQRAAAF
ncbi:MAG: hypothetical protein LW816_19490 [Planctomyces sp.]|nr:hypothetical protein [Planctomyces sp.]